MYEAVLFVVAEDEGIYQELGKITPTMPANYTELEKRLWEAADELRQHLCFLKFKIYC
ncbi:MULTISPECIES: hypothetical protein [unclassified Microcoleus]|uniref:hypothetical protein n=1 Tax=unclassified Microcoleus TaxID=2642155 RepID=UPI002FD20CD6